MVAGMAAAQNVGINTTLPRMPLHIYKAGDTALLLLENSVPLAVDANVGMYFRNANFYTGAIKTIGDGSTIARLGLYTFAAGNQNNLKERLTILDNGNVGIGTIEPTATLDVMGSFKLTNGSQEKGKMLTTDNNGNSSWVWGDPIWFSATRTSNTICIPSNTAFTVPYNSIEGSGNISGLLNIATNTFNAPVAGLYHFDLSVDMNPSGTGSDVTFQLMKNGTAVRSTYRRVPVATTFIVNFSCDVQLAVNDVISVRLFNGTGAQACVTNGTDTYFNGHLVR
jgi:hypothetical protein